MARSPQENRQNESPPTARGIGFGEALVLVLVGLGGWIGYNEYNKHQAQLAVESLQGEIMAAQTRTAEAYVAAAEADLQRRGK